MKKILEKICVGGMLLGCAFIVACQGSPAPLHPAVKLRVITTLFPLYDFSREVGQGRVAVDLLLPPGVESHSFEPKAGDIRKIQEADVFIYTGKFMEPWVDDLLKSVDQRKVLIVDASEGVRLLTSGEEGNSDHLHQEMVDPHIWLDLDNAGQMVNNIAAAFTVRDPKGQAYYKKNRDAYRERLRLLDDRFKKSLSQCDSRTIYHAGHFAFGYLARRYHLQYISAYQGVTADAEPTPKRIALLAQAMKNHGSKYIFYEELVEPRIAETIAQETGVRLLMLHAAHNVSKVELDRGVTFTQIMERDLKNLSLGLSCH
ncbi:MAG: zinc ABC transporter substrate-binding protein [Smithellaceae bacterium]|nr:zinc ABC transporter substrate-binding protein [Smithellaceae bacterium]